MIWKARGTTDEINACEHCGRQDLKSTVRMVAVDADGNEDGESYFGSVCASKMSGRPVAEIQREAREADRAAARAEQRRMHDATTEFVDFVAEHGTGSTHFERLESMGGLTAARDLWKQSRDEDCDHHRPYGWTADDGTLCVGCCDCGRVLKGGV